MGGIVHQILDKMSSVAGILLFLRTILIDAANSFTGIEPKRPNGRGGTEPAKVRVNMAEVSRGREPGYFPGERSEGSVIGRCS
jgi:hypothetical protein